MDLSLETPKRRSSDSSSSPEFEFCMVGNPSDPHPELLTADELFVDGVLLPLHLLSVVHSQPDPGPEPDPELEPAEPPPDPSPPPLPPPLEPSPASISSAPSSGSKRWRDIFKVGERKGNEKERPRRERRDSGGSAAEININIWPFSRSRSAGNGGAASGRPRVSSLAGRKASSAPCSRSNSRGESSKPSAGATRRWAASPGRAGPGGGVHLGRTSPVWQIRRGEKRTEPAAGRGPERANQRDKVTGGKRGSGIGSGVRVLNLNVNTCIGYRNQVSCRGNDKDGVTASGDRTAGEGGGGNGSLFNLRSFFSKKVY